MRLTAQQYGKNAGYFFLAFLYLTATRVLAITAGQVDTFQDGTTMNWEEGFSSPNPPSNIATGGPAGAGDKFLRDVSSGGGGAGSRMVVLNHGQWTGNYNSTGTSRITADMANLGSTILHMRISIQGGPGSTRYSSTVATDLPADGLWRSVTFDLTPSAMTKGSGTDTLSAVLGSVIELRILSAAAGPTHIGDSIVGTLGVDNIAAVDVAAQTLRITDFRFVGNVPRVTFTTVSGRSYRVERKNALGDSMWTTLSNAMNVAGTGAEVQISDTEPGAGSLPMRFYHVVILPPS